MALADTVVELLFARLRPVLVDAVNAALLGTETPAAAPVARVGRPAKAQKAPKAKKSGNVDKEGEYTLGAHKGPLSSWMKELTGAKKGTDLYKKWETGTLFRKGVALPPTKRGEAAYAAALPVRAARKAKAVAANAKKAPAKAAPAAKAAEPKPEAKPPVVHKGPQKAEASA